MHRQMADGLSGEPKIYEIDGDGNPVGDPSEDERGWILVDSDSESDDMLDEPRASEVLGQMQDDRMGETTEAILDLIIWSIPFVFIFVLLNVLVQQQYAIQPTITGELLTVLLRVPRKCARSAC